MKPTTNQEMDVHLERLNDCKTAWVKTPIARRIQLLGECMDATLAMAPEMVVAACEAKGIPLGHPAEGEEWLGGPMTIMRNLRLLVRTLSEVQSRGAPRLEQSDLTRRPDGQVKVRVFPQDGYDKLLYQGFTGEVWVEPGVEEQEVLQGAAGLYRGGERETGGKVALVLGAGNVASIGPMDVLYKLLSEDQVCLLKMNPVNEYLGPFIMRGLAPLVKEGVLRLVYGGAEVGEYLVQHDGIDEIHITGSDFVHDIIVWGPPGEEQDRRKAAGEPLTDKRITSELGCVTPVIIAPGPWTEKELAFQAENIAAMVANNASFNCNAAKLLVTSKSWPQREELLRRVEEVLADLPPRQAYYPGSDGRYQRFMDAHPEANALSAGREGVVPWTTIYGVDPAADDIVFSDEAWCAVLAETALEADEPDEFLRQAADFVNERVWGTLSCAVIVHPSTEASMGPEAFEDRLASLRYGSVVVNHWPALSYGLVATTWGAFPGHSLADIGSGIGTVHNTSMIPRPERSVIRGPFMVSPKPPWFVTHAKGAAVGRALTRLEHRPSVIRLAATVFNALRG